MAIVVLPVLALILRASPAALAARLTDPLVLSALRLSLITSAATTVLIVLCATPLAWFLARRTFRGRRVLSALLDLPMVLPPTVAGFALLLALGRAGLAGRVLQLGGITLPFTTLGVIVAQFFMAAPFYLRSAQAGFAGVERRFLDAAASLGAGEFDTFRRVVLPLSWPSLLAGMGMSAARALGEFGATITFAGNLPGTTQTMPLAVYVTLQSDFDAAIVLAVLLLVMSAALLLALRALPVGLLGGGADASR